MVDWDHGYQAVIHHQFQTLRLQRRIMTAVVAHFVEYRSGQQIRTGDRLLAARVVANFPLQILPARQLPACASPGKSRMSPVAVSSIANTRLVLLVAESSCNAIVSEVPIHAESMRR